MNYLNFTVFVLTYNFVADIGQLLKYLLYDKIFDLLATVR